MLALDGNIFLKTLSGKSKSSDTVPVLHSKYQNIFSETQIYTFSFTLCAFKCMLKQKQACP